MRYGNQQTLYLQFYLFGNFLVELLYFIEIRQQLFDCISELLVGLFIVITLLVDVSLGKENTKLGQVGEGCLIDGIGRQQILQVNKLAFD